MTLSPYAFLRLEAFNTYEESLIKKPLDKIWYNEPPQASNPGEYALSYPEVV
jgi:hypothetical protein